MKCSEEVPISAYSTLSYKHYTRARTPRDANLISANPICFTMNEQRGMAERPEAEYHPDQGHERDGKSGCWQYWAILVSEMESLPKQNLLPRCLKY